VRSLTRHLTVTDDIGKAGVDILLLALKEVRARQPCRYGGRLLLKDSLTLWVDGVYNTNGRM
jgi:hypothetical protein